MPGGWTMSMVWMRMPEQNVVRASLASFLSMWIVMMVAIMLPSLVPALLRYRPAVGGSRNAPLGRLTAASGPRYFFVWTMFRIGRLSLGVALAAFRDAESGASPQHSNKR